MPSPGDASGRRVGSFWPKLLVSMALLAYQLRSGRVAGVAELLAHAGLFWVLAGIGVYVASHLLNALRWDGYARSFGLATQTGRSVRYYFAGLFLNLFAPGTIVGDVSRGMALGRGQSRAVALASVVAHRLTGVVALLVVAGVAGAVQTEIALDAPLQVACWAIPLAGIAGVLFLPTLLGRGGALLGRPMTVPASWRPATLVTLVVAAIYHAVQVVAVICLARALAIPASVAALALFVPLVNAAGMVPITVAGLGIREAAYVYLLGLIGVAADQALSLGLLASVLVFACGLCGMPAFLVERSTDNPAERG